MHALVRTVFSRLHKLDPVAEEEKLKTSEEDAQDGEIRMTVSANSMAPSSDSPSDLHPNEELHSGEMGNDVSVLQRNPPSPLVQRSECESPANVIGAGSLKFLL
jgi:brefeldin A-resistance guanine nucleotide exchange factor 1